MKGHEINGTLEDGDWLEIVEKIDPAGRIRSATNLSIGARIHVRNFFFTGR